MIWNTAVTYNLIWSHQLGHLWSRTIPPCTFPEIIYNALKINLIHILRRTPFINYNGIINIFSTYKTRGVIVDASSGIPKRCECKNRKINAAKVWKHQRVYANFRTRFVHAWMMNNNKQLQLITYSASRIEWINYQEYLVDYWGMV